MKTKQGKDHIRDMSLEFRAGTINGKTDTMQDSQNFDAKDRNKVDSLAAFAAGSPVKKSMSPGPKGKRESIYKAALMSGKALNMEGNLAEASSIDSQSEDGERGESPKKSRFGPKS